MSVPVLVDSPRCWVVAISMMIYTFFAMAVLKSTSVIYVGSMQMLELTREEASWPVTLTVVLSQLAGPVYGLMLKLLSERLCLIIGALLCSLPLMAAAVWAVDIVTLCLLVGVIHGLGIACCEVIPFVILMRHFQKYRGTVISAMYIITAVSGFLMPVLYENIRQSWNFRVCLFAMGALNFGMLLGCIVVTRIPVIASSSEGKVFSQSSSSSHFSDLSLSIDPYLVSSILMTKSQQSNRSGSSVEVASRHERAPLLSEMFTSAQISAQVKQWRLFSIKFIHVTISRAATIFALAAFLLVVLDYSADRHLDHIQGVLMLTLFSVGDLMSRILSGSLIDFRIVAHSLLMSATFLIQGVSYLLLVYVDVYGLMLLAAFLVGITGGCRNTLATVMVAENCGEASLALSLGVMNFVTGITIVFQPALIGYVRDSIGSYEPLFFSFVICNITLFVTWCAQTVYDCRKVTRESD